MAVATWAVLAVLEFVVLGLFTGYLVRYFATKGSPNYALILVFISW
jgi:hypothetical protein